MSLEKDLDRFVIRLQARRKEIFLRTCALAFDSIVNGSPVTGAPGQPVDTGALRASWSLTFESPTVALISTAIEYAPYVEDNVRGVQFKNHGPHSVKMTRAAIQKVVDVAVSEVAGVG